MEPIAAVDLDQDAGANILIYGMADAGKTVLCSGACMVEDARPVLLINTDNSWDSIPRRPGLDVLPVSQGPQGWGEVEAEVLKSWKGESTYRTLIIDSLTTLQRMGLHDVVATNASRMGNKGGTRSIYLPDQADYGVSNRRLLALVRTLRALARERNMVVLMTALEVEDKDEDTGSLLRRPLLSPSVRSKLPGILDHIGRLSKARDGSRVMRWSSTDRVLAKHRHDPEKPPRLPDTQANPTMSDILNRLGYKA